MMSWTDRSDKELLELRFCDLGLELGGELLNRSLSELYRELKAHGFRFRPHVWLSDEWFCPDGVPGFAVPFYLAHPRLRRLERHQMLDVEGGTQRRCLRLLRHETGHALDNAFRLRRKHKRRKLFGDPETVYPEFYAPKPFSRRYVRHSEAFYAQSHPDEDFAETFAVWLDPGSDWRKRYEGWPARGKLLYVDELMAELAGKRPLVTNRKRPGELSGLDQSLAEHYQRKRQRFKVDFSQHYESDLARIFVARGGPSAADFLRRHRASLRRHVSQWTGIRSYTVDEVLGDWISRARAQKLCLGGNEEEALQDVATAVTVRVMQYLQSGHYRVAL